MTNKIFIGCSGFTGRDWKGFFFPEDLPAKEQLNFYSEYFSAVEINSTFYRKPQQQTLQNWLERSVPNFKFFVKVPKTITHLKKLEKTETETSDFCRYLQQGSGDKLAGFLFQLPPSFHFSDENLQKVIQTVDYAFLNVVEFRHQSWWREEVFQILSEKNIVFSGVSYPKNISDELITNNSNVGYYRLHGVPVMFKSEYSETEIELLADKIRNANRDFYVFFNNTWGTAALKNAMYLKKILKI